jgi:hypothetical protein
MLDSLRLVAKVVACKLALFSQFVGTQKKNAFYAW